MSKATDLPDAEPQNRWHLEVYARWSQALIEYHLSQRQNDNSSLSRSYLDRCKTRAIEYLPHPA